MSPVRDIRNQARNLLGLRRNRKPGRVGPKPRIGSHAVFQDVRITVQAGLTEELWSWMVEQGWREAIFRPERRRYREVPASYVTRLIDSVPEERPRILATALEKAVNKPTVGDPEALPAYLKRR